MCSVWKGLPQSAMYYSALPSASFLAGGSCGCVGAAVLSGLSMTMTGEVCWAVSLPPMAPAIRDLISKPHSGRKALCDLCGAVDDVTQQLRAVAFAVHRDFIHLAERFSDILGDFRQSVLDTPHG